MNWDKYIGNKTEFSFEHRLLNTILTYGIVITAGTIAVNFFLGMGLLVTGISAGNCLVLAMLYCLSMKRKMYRTVAALLVGFIFVVTPVMWLSNGGLLGGCTFYIILFSATIAILLRDRARMILGICLTLMTLALIVLEYRNPALIMGYNSDWVKYADTSIGLLISVAANSLIFVLIINQYIGEHKRANMYLAQIEKQKIESLNQQFVRVFNASPSLMAIYREKDYEYLAVNDAWLNALGYERSEIIGQTETEINILMLDDRKTGMTKPGPGTMENMRVRTKQGETRDWLVSKAALEMDGHACILLASIDRTAMHHLERNIARLDRLNLIGEIAASIGHEIRNPLTTVRGFLQLFQSRPEYGRDREHVDVMIGELDRTNAIITEFLSLAKNRLINLKARDLNKILEGLYPLIDATAVLEGKEVILKLDSPLPKVLVDESEIRQLVLNLARNAIEAMPSGGRLILGTRVEGEGVIVTVQDTGGGIPQEILERLGMPFLTTKERGTGLGLAVCYRIAQRHYANIEVETGGAGTTFSVKFSALSSLLRDAAGAIPDMIPEEKVVNP